MFIRPGLTAMALQFIPLKKLALQVTTYRFYEQINGN